MPRTVAVCGRLGAVGNAKQNALEKQSFFFCFRFHAESGDVSVWMLRALA